MIAPLANASLDDIELELLLEAVFRYTGFDFREYAPATLKRRTTERLRAEGLPSLSALQDLVLHDLDAMERLLFAISGTPGRLFAEPAFFRTLREDVVPRLRTFPLVRIWCAGTPGEEAYSLAIVLHEEGLLRRSKIYATDTSETAVGRARACSVAREELEDAAERYREAGARADLHDYFASGEDGQLRLVEEIGHHLVFAQHSLATDASFNEFQLIVSRNVLTHFTKPLAYRAHQVFFESLSRLGFIGLGQRESMLYTPYERCFEPISAEHRIYRLVRS